MAYADRCESAGALLEYHPFKTDIMSDLRSSLPYPEGRYKTIVIDPPWPMEYHPSKYATVAHLDDS